MCRRLISCVPPDLATSTTPSTHSAYLTNPDHHWLHPLSANRRGPRALLTYVDEARNQLRKRLDDNPNCKLRQHLSSMPSMFAPDILRTSDDDTISSSMMTSDEHRIMSLVICGCIHHRQSAIHQVILHIDISINLSFYRFDYVYYAS